MSTVEELINKLEASLLALEAKQAPVSGLSQHLLQAIAEAKDEAKNPVAGEKV
jgi:hypothetical protein